MIKDRRRNTNLTEDVELLLPVKFREIPLRDYGREVKKMAQPLRGQGGHLGFPIGPKSTKDTEHGE